MRGVVPPCPATYWQLFVQRCIAASHSASAAALSGWLQTGYLCACMWLVLVPAMLWQQPQADYLGFSGLCAHVCLTHDVLAALAQQSTCAHVLCGQMDVGAAHTCLAGWLALLCVAAGVAAATKEAQWRPARQQ